MWEFGHKINQTHKHKLFSLNQTRTCSKAKTSLEKSPLVSPFSSFSRSFLCTEEKHKQWDQCAADKPGVALVWFSNGNFGYYDNCMRQQYPEAASLFGCTGSPSGFPHQCPNPAKVQERMNPHNEWTDILIYTHCLPLSKIDESIMEKTTQGILPP